MKLVSYVVKHRLLLQFSYVFVDKCLGPAISQIIQLQRKCHRRGTTAMDNYACNNHGTCFLSI